MIARTMPTYHTLGSSRNGQRGGALLVMLVFLVMGITTVFVTSLSSTAINNKRNQTTAEALAQAKEALIGYAVTYGDDPVHVGETDGYLPCPDMDGTAGGTPYEGVSETCGNAGENTLGRLPWKTLKLLPLFDGAQECLWYVVSGNYKNNPKSGLVMNWDTPAQLKIYSAEGMEISPGEIVALVIAPGAPVSGNSNRAGSSAPICGGHYTAEAYLENDTLHGPNNTNAATGEFIMPHDHRDTDGNVTLSTNDQFVYITRQDIWTAAEKRIAREAKQCLDAYAASSGGKYPLATSVSMSSAPSLFGRLSSSPNRSKPRSQDLEMVSRFETLIPLLLTFRNNRTSQNFAAINTPASTAKQAARDVREYYEGINSTLENAADDLKDAADTAMDWTSWPSTSSIDNVLNEIYSASADFSTNLPIDTGILANWHASCTLFSSERWTNHWQNLVFYQLADGYRPGTITPSCGSSCLSIEGSGHSAAGSGSYRAVIIAAGKMLTANRNPSVTGDYLDPVNPPQDNLLPQIDISNPYKTYRTTDVAHESNNDLVLCLDGGAGNCP